MRPLLLNVGHFQTHFFLLLYPTVVLTLEREGAGSYGDLLLPATAAWIAFAGFTLPAAWAGDRFPKPRLLLLLFLGLALGSGLAALAQSTWQLTAALALIGAAAASYHPVGIALLVEQSPQTGRAVGVNGVWGNLGVAAAPLAASAMPRQYNPDSVIDRLAAPLLIFRSDDDRVVPPSHADTLFERATAPKVRIKTTGRHTATFNDEANSQGLLDFLDAHLGGAAKTSRQGVPGERQ